jgi:cyclin-dependent kinase
MLAPSKQDLLADFDDLKRIGRGIHGEVYSAAVRAKPGLRVALKRVCLADCLEIGVPPSVIREVGLLRSMDPHENVVKLLDVKMCAAEICMVFELMDCDLHAHLKALPPGEHLGADTLRSFSRQLLSGVAWCHRHGVMHRDLKPHNLLIGDGGRRLKLADLGMSRMFSYNRPAYTPIVVTLWYRAPDVLLGSKEYSYEVDLWSVGCIIVEMATRASPFPGESEMDQLFRIFRERGTPTEAIWPGVTKLPYFQAAFPVHQPKKNWLPAIAEKSNALCADLVNALLAYDPQRRLTAKCALDHPYFFELESPSGSVNGP